MLSSFHDNGKYPSFRSSWLNTILCVTVVMYLRNNRRIFGTFIAKYAKQYSCKTAISIQQLQKKTSCGVHCITFTTSFVHEAIIWPRMNSVKIIIKWYTFEPWFWTAWHGADSQAIRCRGLFYQPKIVKSSLPFGLDLLTHAYKIGRCLHW